MSHRRARRAHLGTLVLLVALAAVAAPAHASPVELEGQRFEPQLRLQDRTLRLYDAALFRYGRIFKVYASALYLPEGVDGPRVLDDVPKQLEIAYLVAFRADQFREATREGIRRNVSAQEFERLRPRIDALNALYRDVREGDRYALHYVPGVGTTLVLNGEALGTVEGADFARAVFSIWLGEQPFDARLKERLLDGA